MSVGDRVCAVIIFPQVASGNEGEMSQGRLLKGSDLTKRTLVLIMPASRVG